MYFIIYLINSEFFTHMETIACEELQLLTYDWHLWPFSSEGSLACHSYFGINNYYTAVFNFELYHQLTHLARVKSNFLG